VIEMRRAIAANPRHVGNHFKLANMLEFDPPGRIKALRQAFELEPARGQTAARIGMVYASIGAKDEAIAWAHHATETSPTNAVAWAWAMFAMLNIGDTDAAIEFAEEALRLAPGNVWALRELGFLEIAEGETGAVLERWQDAYPLVAAGDQARIDASNATVAVDFASNLVEAGETDWARDLLGESLAHLQDDPDYSQIAQELLDGRNRFLDKPSDSDQAEAASLLLRVRSMECSGEMPVLPDLGWKPPCP
jgi:tetratricopeptide (TPR) repeat protein